MTAEDWQLYRRVRLAALQEAPYAFGSNYEHEAKFEEATWRRRVGDRTRFVAEVDGVVAGTVSGGGLRQSRQVPSASATRTTRSASSA